MIQRPRPYLLTYVVAKNKTFIDKWVAIDFAQILHCHFLRASLFQRPTFKLHLVLFFLFALLIFSKSKGKEINE